MGRDEEPSIFELSVPGRRAWSFRTTALPEWTAEELVPDEHRRDDQLDLAEVSERDLVAHVTRLTHRQYSVDLGAYPLGSCTMKYNPKLCDRAAAIPGLASAHPATPAAHCQGWLELLVELGSRLCAITGMEAITLQPPAGAAGELTGLLLMRAWHQSQGHQRTKVIIPDSAHGTNPASVTLGGYETVTVPSDRRGLVDLDALRRRLDEDVAGIMLTNPNTLGLFEEDIVEMARSVHEVGGLLYYDGANLNAILGVTRPGDMGFDIVHMNLHKTFAVPHGGGGPGAGPVAVQGRLAEFLPGPLPVREGDGYSWFTPPRSIGRVHGWYGNTLALARAYSYIVANGGDGLRRVAEAAVLNANWLRQRIRGSYDIPFDRPNMHEFVASTRSLKKATGLKALDVAKRLLEEGFHAPTVYFPLIVEEALMFEPTETESLQTLEALAEALERIAGEAVEAGNAEEGRAAPRTAPVRRVDEARAARRLIPTFDARPLAVGDEAAATEASPAARFG
ncbi:MAG: aminomethyl-transferring glycine dehydrogenase subunit GcvPB [Actinobacteria bacterium]|nr:aminomethyl-transferring glycine dehydrogenase subunit GcvPB [Actinomycetota bacterium]MBW3650492.1 aminomethyl-transferring glycine dehydrogenase subunit GcvPB [Actinomycetota bacterium]